MVKNVLGDVYFQNRLYFKKNKPKIFVRNNLFKSTDPLKEFRLLNTVTNVRSVSKAFRNIVNTVYHINS